MNYTWDVRGNLTGVSGGGGSTISFTYDLFGRRLSKTVNGTPGGLKLWDGWLSANPFAGGEGANPVEYLNAQGSVERRKGTGGAADQTFSYAPYGAVTSAEPSPGTEVTASRWAGMEPDRADLYYARHRYYHPHIGRFISEDPIGLNGGMNLFAYVGGDPVNFIDPMGLSGENAWGIQGYTWGQYWNDVWAFGKGEFKVLAVSVGMGIAFCAAPGVMIPVAMGLLAYSIYKCGASKVGGDFVNGFKFWDAGSMGEAGERFGNVLSLFLPSFCFPEGTPVQMADGSVKPIEQVREGDAVASRDTMTGRSVSARVLETSKRTAGELVTVALADPATGKVVETLRATPEHPFFVEGRGWVELGQVGIGSEIVTRAGPNLVVQSVSRERFEQGVAVYNFAVEGTHSYFVGRAEGGAWVHNFCARTITRDAAQRISSVRASITPADLGTGTGTTAAARASVDAGDDAGHIIARMLGGPGGATSENIMSQARASNRGDYRVFEGQIARYIRSTGHTVTADVTLNYTGASTRPSTILYEVYDGSTLILNRLFTQ